VPTLFQWADAPSASPSPFPPSTGRPWHAGDLPGDALAETLASRGYSRASATSDHVERDGDRIPRALVDEAVADLLGDLAARVSASDTAADDASLDAEARALESGAPFGPWGSPEHDAHLAALRAAEAVRQRMFGAQALARSLELTARDLRRKPRAAAIITRRIIARLPISAPAADDLAEAADWLSQYDALERVRRADVARAYTAARTPGSLTPFALRDLMSNRWGATCKRDGYDVHKPAAATRGPSGPDLATMLTAIIATHGRDALDAAYSELPKDTP
jgi:hypothetical protein